MIAGEIFPKMMEIYELAESQKNFVNSYYEKEGNFNHFFIVDKETTSLFLVDLERNSIEFMGQVGIGRNRGDRDVSGGRETGKGSYQTQAGWVRINRVSAEFSEGTKSHENYGDQFYGFDAWVENTWKEVPTGIHGTEHETEGWVSGGCTRLCEPLEDNLRENYLDRGVLFYYTSDEGSTTSG